MSNFRGFAPSNKPGTCKWCGAKLQQQMRAFTDGPAGEFIPRGQRTEPVYGKPGAYGDGFFCTMRCGYQFGVAMADEGRQFKAVTQ